MYLAVVLTEKEVPRKQIVATFDDNVICAPTKSVELLAPCSHEETDTRMLLHSKDAAKQGMRNILLRTVDTDVLVIAVSVFHQLNVETLWIAFGVGKHFRYISIHDLVNTMGLRRSIALPMFHALTGCDTVSSMCGRGKRTAYDTWSVFPNLTDAIISIMNAPDRITDENFDIIERFIILLYDRTSTQTSVNACRKELFSKKNRSMENIPPTKDALKQHVKRAFHQAVHCWKETLVLQPSMFPHSDWGWALQESKWTQVWMTIPEAAKSCYELLRCNCIKSCTAGRCKCRKSFLKCTSLCKCGGECDEVIG